ncbi:hypothetical protein Vafri_4818, partial [Volvox africanus]
RRQPRRIPEVFPALQILLADAPRQRRQAGQHVGLELAGSNSLRFKDGRGLALYLSGLTQTGAQGRHRMERVGVPITDQTAYQRPAERRMRGVLSAREGSGTYLGFPSPLPRHRHTHPATIEWKPGALLLP